MSFCPYRLAELNPESPLPCPRKSDIELDVNKAVDTDQKSNSAVDSFESRETIDPLLDSQPTVSNEDHTLGTSTVNSKSNGDRLNQQLMLETIADLYGPRLECIEDELASPPTAEQTVYQNHLLRDQFKDNDYTTTGAGDIHHSASDLTQGASKEKIPVLCTESPHRNVVYSYQGNGVPSHSSELPGVGVLEGHSGHQSSIVTYQENSIHLQSPELHGIGVEGHVGRPCSTVSEGGCTAAACMLPIQEAQSDCCDRGCMVGVQADSPNFDRGDVQKVYKGIDSKMNEQGHRHYVDSIVNGDSQSQNSEPNNDNLPLDRQGSNDSQENEN